LVAETRRKLQVTAQTAPGAHEVHITITCAVDGAHSATVVNGLAQHYADQCRTKLQIDAEQVLQSAHGAHQRARQRATAAKTAMDEYLNDALRQRAAADDAGQSPERPLNKTPGAANSPSDREAGPQATAAGHELRLTNNPQWATLNDQLQSLRSRRTELLATRTPLHPEIRDVDSHIIQVEEQLASTRRQIVDKLADLPVIINGSVQSSIVHPATATRKAVAAPRRIAENAEATETYHKLSDALAQANAAVEQAAAAESQARQEQTQLPLIEILPANMAATASPQLAVLLAPLRLALAAGLAMALGAGLLLRGMPPPRTFVTANQVQRALSLPVIGVLHESGAAAIASRSALHVAASLLCLALGMLIVAGCGLLMAGQIDHLASYVPWDLHPVTEPMHRFVDILSQKP
jgi:hypothetical protein